MIKYIVTDKHPTLKEGAVIKTTSQTIRDNGNTHYIYNLYSDNNIFIDHFIDIPVLELLGSEWIKEIGNKAWSKNKIKAHKFLEDKLKPSISVHINRNFAANMIAEYHEIELKKIGLKLSSS